MNDLDIVMKVHKFVSENWGIFNDKCYGIDIEAEISRFIRREILVDGPAQVSTGVDS